MDAYQPFLGTISHWPNPNSSFHFALVLLAALQQFGTLLVMCWPPLLLSQLLLHASSITYTVSYLECLPRVDLPLWNRHRFTCLDWWQSSPFLAPSSGLSFRINVVVSFSRSGENIKKEAAMLGFIWGLLCAVGWMINTRRSAIEWRPPRWNQSRLHIAGFQLLR